jgi:hypothetical protein
LEIAEVRLAQGAGHGSAHHASHLLAQEMPSLDAEQYQGTILCPFAAEDPASWILTFQVREGFHVLGSFESYPGGL